MRCFLQCLARRSRSGCRFPVAACALGIGISTLVLAAVAKGDSARPAAYRIIDLGTMGSVSGLNNQGQVGGIVPNHTPWGGGVIYDQTGLHDLGVLGGTGVYSRPIAINDLGAVVGVAATPPVTDGIFKGLWTNHAFLYDGASMRDLGTLGGDQSNAVAVNDAGQVIGMSMIAPGSMGPQWHAFTYSDGAMRDLGFPPDLDFAIDANTSIEVRGINASGQILVEIRGETTRQYRVYLWQNGLWEHLSALDGEDGWALNDAGQITGSADLGPGSIPAGHAFTYDNTGVHDLGTLGGPISRALGINSGGQIVGTAQIIAPPPVHPWLYESNGVADHPFLYSGGVMYDLTDLLLTSVPWERFAPIAINDRGEILGEATWGFGTVGSGSVRPQYFLLDPVPTATVTLPSAPSGASVKLVSLHELDLSWADNSNNEQSFEIQRRQSWSDWVTISSVPPNTTTFADTSVDPYTHYIYRVRAMDGAGASDWSNEAAGDSGSGAVASLGWNAQDFGSIPLGATSAVFSLTITNRGTAPLTVPSATLAGSNPGDFAVVDSPATLAPGDTGAVHLRFAPAARGSRSAQLILHSNAASPIPPIGLTGSGAPPQTPTIGIIPTALNFGAQPMGLSGSLAVLLQNTGTAPLTVSGITLQGPNAAEFSLAPGGWTGGILQPGQITLLNVRFSPGATGTRSASLAVADDAADSPQIVSLTGVGTAPLLVLNATGLVFSLHPAADGSSTQTLTLTNNGDAPLTIDPLSLSGPSAGSFQIVSDTGEKSLAPGASRTVTIAFSPAATASIRSAARIATAARIAATSYSATLEIKTNDPHAGSPHEVSLTAVDTGGVTPPAAPTGLTATVNTANQVALAWTDHSNNETAFAIWRQTGDGAFERVGVVVPNRTSFLDTGVAPKTAYTYEVRATNDFYASTWSNQATVTTTAPAPPAAPTGLKVVHAASGKVTLGWTDNSSNEAAFEIWRKAGGGSYVFLSYMPANATGFSDPTVSPATSYTYTIRAINTPLASSFTPGVTVTTPAAPPAAPTGLKTVSVSAGKVTLGWTDNSSSEAAFEIWRKTAGGSYVFLSYMPANATSFTDPTVSPATSYTYTIRAINAPLASAFTPGVTVTTPAAP
jgi:probable HAF family extracellular repeat protein